MTEYIKRKAAYNAIVNNYTTDEQLRDLDGIPAADVVEVVRCWNCKHYNKPRLGFCEAYLMRMHGDDFCSYGKKREER